jgi:hypothetical protein
MNDEQWLDRVTATLKAPVEPERDLAPAIMARIRSRSGRGLGRGAPVWIGIAAVAAVALMSVRSRLGSPPSTAPGETKVPFELRMAASRVTVVGDFNGWDRTGTPLARKRGSDQWEATIALPSGVYRYAFLVDDARWVSDPNHAGSVDQDFGEPTSLLTVR